MRLSIKKVQISRSKAKIYGLEMLKIQQTVGMSCKSSRREDVEEKVCQQTREVLMLDDGLMETGDM